MDDKKKSRLSLKKDEDGQLSQSPKSIWGKKQSSNSSPKQKQTPKPEQTEEVPIKESLVQIGETHTLTVKALMSFGAKMDGKNLGDVYLPKKHMPESLLEGSELSVFLYQDSDDQIIATTQLPLVELHQCAYLKVVDVTKIGAFVDWGMPKDLLIPFAEQRNEMRNGQHVVVYVYQNKASGKLAASTKLSKYLEEVNTSFKERDEVHVLVCDHSDLGYKVVINNTHLGLIHRSDVYQQFRVGHQAKAYIKEIRPDGKINVTTHIPNKAQLGDLADQILADLQANGGISTLTDKSDPDLIKAKWKVSKGSYKKALGKLYKARKINITPRSITLSDEK